MAEQPRLFADLSPAAQTNFAELFEQSLAATLNRSVSDLPGSFNKKTVKGRDYWYWQVRDLEGVNRQVYLGPDDERLVKLIQQHGQGKSRSSGDLGGLAGACVCLGCMTVISQHFAIINRMAEYGFFRTGGVLIGTHAFIAMANMLGVRWTIGWRTSDVDFAHAGKNVSVALANNVRADMHDAITSLEMGLLPQNSLVAGPGATYITAKKDVRVDLLTTAGRKDAVYHYEPLNINLQPLKFMEFSLERPTQTALISGEQAVVVNIPSPMRYAMHKLVIMGEREEAFRTKVSKDAGQVAALVEYGLLRSPAALKAAAQDLMSRGPDWRSRAAEGVRHVKAAQPEIGERLGTVLKMAAPAKTKKIAPRVR
jgi:hypothetical protein